MEQTLNHEALSLLERMRDKMLMLYPPIDSAADEMMADEQAPGLYAIGFSLRTQYLSLWKDWEQLERVIPFSTFSHVRGVAEASAE